jgi:ATP-dependent Clp protease ATP-binding subunit ClpA
MIWFNPLDNRTVDQVVNKFRFELEQQLAEKNVTIEVDEAARQWLAAHGIDEKMGARPMARAIQEHIKRPLAEELLFGQLSNGGHIRVSADDEGLRFSFDHAEEAVH